MTILAVLTAFMIITIVVLSVYSIGYLHCRTRIWEMLDKEAHWSDHRIPWVRVLIGTKAVNESLDEIDRLRRVRFAQMVIEKKSGIKLDRYDPIFEVVNADFRKESKEIGMRATPPLYSREGLPIA